MLCWRYELRPKNKYKSKSNKFFFLPHSRTIYPKRGNKYLVWVRWKGWSDAWRGEKCCSEHSLGKRNKWHRVKVTVGNIQVNTIDEWPTADMFSRVEHSVAKRGEKITGVTTQPKRQQCCALYTFPNLSTSCSFVAFGKVFCKSIKKYMQYGTGTKIIAF